MVRAYAKGSPEMVSKYFTASDFDCPCTRCSTTLIDEDLPLRLEFLVSILKQKPSFDSAFRCPAHQEDLRAQGLQTAVGTSTHEEGRAVDLKAHGFSGATLEIAARQVGFKAVGVAVSWVHVDTRADKIRRWTYPLSSPKSGPQSAPQP